MDEHQDQPVQGTRELKRVAILANAATCVLALLAIIACALLYIKVSRDNTVRECVRRIDLFVQDLRDDVNLTGWDVLVARSQGDRNQDVNAIASQMRKDIDSIKKSHDLRRGAIDTCERDADYKPE